MNPELLTPVKARGGPIISTPVYIKLGILIILSLSLCRWQSLMARKPIITWYNMSEKHSLAQIHTYREVKRYRYVEKGIIYVLLKVYLFLAVSLPNGHWSLQHVLSPPVY